LAATDAAMDVLDSRPTLLSTTLTSLFVIGGRALALTYSGRLDEADKLSLTIPRSGPDRRPQGEMEGFGHGQRAHAQLSRGHLPEALRHARRALEIAETLDSPLSQVAARVNCCYAGSLLGLWSEIEHWAEAGIEIIRAHHVSMQLEPVLLTFWAESLADRDEIARARELNAEAISKAQPLGARIYEFRAHLGHARIELRACASDNTGTIAAALDRAEQLTREIGLVAWLPWVHEERAALAAMLGDETHREAHLQEARRLYRNIGASGHLERLTAKSG
jgi:hypothetical protein